MPKSYKREQPTGTYDWIIIGSGMSGMALAAILAKEGKRCLVLERHYTPGGFTHVFKRRGYEWDVGIHYIGEVHREGKMLNRLFKYITDGQLQWAEMGEVYDRIFFGEKAYDFVKGEANFRGQLKEYFPAQEDQRAIDDYVRLIREVSYSARYLFMERGLSPLAGRVLGATQGRQARRFAAQTTRAVLETLTQNEELIGVLTGQFGDYGLPPGQSSFLMHAAVAKHYLNGGSYPVGGSARIFETVEPVIEAGGGEVFINAEVERILVENGRAAGVRMADGREIRAGTGVVSSAGIRITYDQLLAGTEETADLTEKLQPLASSVSHLCLYVGFQKTVKELQMPRTNYWIYPPHYNHDENVARFLEDPDNAPFPVVYVSFPAAKDPDWPRRYPGRSTLEIITLADYDWFKQWEDRPWKKRGAEYEAFKERFSQRLLAKMYDYLPQLRGQVDHYELSTPLSTRHFVNYPTGEIYGLVHTPDRMTSRRLHVRTPVKDLYLTGQDLVSCGIGGALSAALFTAGAIEGAGVVRRVMSDG